MAKGQTRAGVGLGWVGLEGVCSDGSAPLLHVAEVGRRVVDQDKTVDTGHGELGDEERSHYQLVQRLWDLS